MFRKRGLILVTLSLVLGLSAAMVARGWVADQTNKEKANVATIVAATMAIPFGTKVEERHLKIIEMPKDSVPPGSFTLKEEVVDKVC
jgi:pilus assembly protein CpaB